MSELKAGDVKESVVADLLKKQREACADAYVLKHSYDYPCREIKQHILNAPSPLDGEKE